MQEIVSSPRGEASRQRDAVGRTPNPQRRAARRIDAEPVTFLTEARGRHPQPPPKCFRQVTRSADDGGGRRRRDGPRRHENRTLSEGPAAARKEHRGEVERGGGVELAPAIRFQLYHLVARIERTASGL